LPWRFRLHPGETLAAHAVQHSKAGAAEAFTTIRDNSNTIVAKFCGHSRTITGHLPTPISNISQ
jgi:hypothetical protein